MLQCSWQQTWRLTEIHSNPTGFISRRFRSNRRTPLTFFLGCFVGCMSATSYLHCTTSTGFIKLSFSAIYSKEVWCVLIHLPIFFLTRFCKTLFFLLTSVKMRFPLWWPIQARSYQEAVQQSIFIAVTINFIVNKTSFFMGEGRQKHEFRIRNKFPSYFWHVLMQNVALIL